MPKVGYPKHSFGSWMRDERKKHRWSVADLARHMTATGVVTISRSKVGQMELHDEPGSIPLERLEALALVYDLPFGTVAAKAGLEERAAPVSVTELSLEEQGAVVDLRSMPPEERRHWIHLLRASKEYGRSAASRQRQGRS